MENITTSTQPTETNTSVSYPMMAGFWERFAASFIDGIILAVVAGILSSPVVIIGQNTDYAPVISMITSILSFGISVAYYVYFYTKQGQSIGKKLLKLKVVNASDLSYLSAGKVVLRDVVGKWVSQIVFCLGFFWYFMSEKRQTWHDSIASSYVVKTDESGNILMTGSEKYQKKPVLAFLPMGCFAVLTILVVVGIVMAIASASSDIGKYYGDTDTTTDPVTSAASIPEEAIESRYPQNVDLQENVSDVDQAGCKSSSDCNSGYFCIGDSVDATIGTCTDAVALSKLTEEEIGSKKLLY